MGIGTQESIIFWPWNSKLNLKSFIIYFYSFNLKRVFFFIWPLPFCLLKQVTFQGIKEDGVLQGSVIAPLLLSVYSMLHHGVNVLLLHKRYSCLYIQYIYIASKTRWNIKMSNNYKVNMYNICSSYKRLSSITFNQNRDIIHWTKTCPCIRWGYFLVK